MLVSDGTRKGWIQGRWFTPTESDTIGVVSTKTFERAAREFAEREAARNEAREAREAFYRIPVVRETDKAVAAPVGFENVFTEWSGEKMIWFPKSVLRDGAAPGWMILQKLRELLRMPGDTARLGQFEVHI